MKNIFILVAVLTLAGCGAADRFGASVTGYAKSCVEGVSYLQFTSGVTVQYDTNGAIVKCSK